MLQTLNIENVALIDKATLNFGEMLNVISGETGAGKSILLDSLVFVFGGRADRSLIRENCKSMKVEAVFSCLSDTVEQEIFNEINISCKDELFLSRELDITGKNICKINGELVPLNSVKKVCLKLVDVHGQSEHLSILNNDYQLEIIDSFSQEMPKLKSKLEDLILQIKQVEKEIASLGGSEKEKQNLIDLYTYQISEIENANISQNEYEDLLQEKKQMQQFEKINNNLTQCYECGNKAGFELSSMDKLTSAVKNLQNINELSDEYNDLYARLNSSVIELKDIFDSVLDCLNSLTFDEQRFEWVDNRIDFLKSLFRKYGGDYESLKTYYNEISVRLDNLKNSEKRYNELVAERDDLLNKINNIQDLMHNERVKVGKTFTNEIQKELTLLGMQNAKMDVLFLRIAESYSINGYDRAELMFSANLGFELKPLNKVVSGGEMSRVMLAYKIVASRVDKIQTIIFDEIDSGLSGEVATVVAKYLARLSRQKQIIAVSHLPQICAMADYNIKVKKYTDNNTTKTCAKTLSENETLLEIARLMGVVDATNNLEAVNNLKQSSTNYKNTIK